MVVDSCVVIRIAVDLRTYDRGAGGAIAEAE
jgi:hypothetical protein